MKKCSLMIIVLISVGLLSCGELQEIPDPLPPTTISFDPPIDEFEGRPGDVLELKINIEGRSGFNHLYLIKTIGDVEVEESNFKERREENYGTPFSMDFSYTLLESEIGLDVKLTFMAEIINRTPSGGTAYSYSRRYIEIKTQAE